MLTCGNELGGYFWWGWFWKLTKRNLLTHIRCIVKYNIKKSVSLSIHTLHMKDRDLINLGSAYRRQCPESSPSEDWAPSLKEAK